MKVSIHGSGGYRWDRNTVKGQEAIQYKFKPNMKSQIYK